MQVLEDNLDINELIKLGLNHRSAIEKYVKEEWSRREKLQHTQKVAISSTTDPQMVLELQKFYHEFNQWKDMIDQQEEDNGTT